MSSPVDLKSVPLPRLLALGGAGLMLVSLFFPLVSVTVFDAYQAHRQNFGATGWEGIGVLIGILTLGLLAWEVLRLTGKVPSLAISADLVTSMTAGALAVLGLVQFLRAIGSGYYGGAVTVGPGFGAFLILVAAVVLGVAALLTFTSGGGAATVRKLRDELGRPAAQPPNDE